MKFELKDFQVTSARGILDELDEARLAASKGKLQAVVLSAPTGSGKTITVAAVIDWTFGGADGIAARPNTTFLWLSDSPELNQQSKGKLLAACDHVPFHRLVTVESDSFDEERLAPGHVYFINTQLLGKDKLLTKGGDKKTFTFWQTVANTIAAGPQDFVLIIDEAHRLRPKTFSDLQDILDALQISVVLVGTDRLDAVMRRDEQIYQRIIMSHRYERLTSAQLVETSVIWEKHVLRLPEPSQLGSAKMQKVLGPATGGYIGLLDRILREAGVRSLQRSAKRIEFNILKEVVAECR